MKSPKTFVVSLLAALIAGSATYLAGNRLASPKIPDQMKDAPREKATGLENLDVKSTLKELKTSSASDEVRTLNGIPVGVVIELDKAVAAQNDRIQIAVVAPYLNDPKRVDTIGGGGNRGSFSIRSSKSMLKNFELKEVGQDRGVYTGEIILSKDVPASFNGLRVDRADSIDCTFQGPEGVFAQAAALVRMNIAELTLEKKDGDTVVVKVADPDLNEPEKKKERISVRAWSDSDVRGIPVTLEETQENNGMFIGEFKLSATPPSSEPDKRLYAPAGKTVTVTHTDYALPAPYGKDDSLDISSSLLR